MPSYWYAYVPSPSDPIDQLVLNPRGASKKFQADVDLLEQQDRAIIRASRALESDLSPQSLETLLSLRYAAQWLSDELADKSGDGQVVKEWIRGFISTAMITVPVMALADNKYWIAGFPMATYGSGLAAGITRSSLAKSADAEDRIRATLKSREGDPTELEDVWASASRRVARTLQKRTDVFARDDGPSTFDWSRHQDRFTVSYILRERARDRIASGCTKNIEGVSDREAAAYNLLRLIWLGGEVLDPAKKVQITQVDEFSRFGASEPFINAASALSDEPLATTDRRASHEFSSLTNA